MQGKHKTVRRRVETFLYLLIGALLTAMAVNIFYLPTKLTMGGISGIASIIYQVSSLPLSFGVFVALLNLPLFIVGGLTISRAFVVNSMIGTVVYSLVIDLTEPFMLEFYEMYLAPPTGQLPDLFISCIIGGVLYGVGLGLMLHAGYTTGGTDILAILIRRRLHHVSLGQVLWVMDAAIIASSAFFYRNTNSGSILMMFYSGIAMYLTSKGIDFILEGFSFQRTAFIISRSPERIGERIMTELDRGLTALKGQGMYTGADQSVLLCVLSKEQIGVLKQIALDEDPNSFIFVMDTREVLGEGFEARTY